MLNHLNSSLISLMVIPWLFMFSESWLKKISSIQCLCFLSKTCQNQSGHKCNSVQQKRNNYECKNKDPIIRINCEDSSNTLTKIISIDPFALQYVVRKRISSSIHVFFVSPTFRPSCTKFVLKLGYVIISSMIKPS